MAEHTNSPEKLSIRKEREELTAIRKFLNSSIHPKYALMLNGEWGAGKTYIINSILDELHRDNQSAIYVSLNGISTIDEISDAIYLELHPKLGGKAAKISKSIFFSVIKNGIKIDLNDAIQIGSGLDTTKRSKYPENAKDFVVIFDDIERCHIPLKKSFGYINRYVENPSLRVIVVANEIELKANGKYSIIKEKTIADTITCSPDFPQAFECFAGEIQIIENRSVILGQKNLIQMIFDESKLKNLRILRHSVSKWHRFISELDLISMKIVIDLLCYEFFAFAFEYYKDKAGVLTNEDNSRLTRLLNSKKEDISKEFENPFKKYTRIESIGFHLPQELWLEYFEGKNLSKETLLKHLIDAGHIGGKTRPLWYRAWDYLDCRTNDFESLVNELNEYIFNTENVKIGDYLHCLSTMFALIRDGLIDKNGKDLFDDVIAHTQEIRYKIDWQDVYRRYGTIDSAYSHIFNSSQDPDFIKVRNALYQIQQKCANDQDFIE